MFDNPYQPPMQPGAAPFGAVNFLEPAMQANAASAQRRQALAARLLQGMGPQQQAPQGPAVMTIADDGPMQIDGRNPFAGVDTKALGEAMRKWMEPAPAANTTGMGVQMGGLY